LDVWKKFGFYFWTELSVDLFVGCFAWNARVVSWIVDNELLSFILIKLQFKSFVRTNFLLLEHFFFSGKFHKKD
jgi:hypothetical protein